MAKLLNLSSGPQTRDRWTTPFIMYFVAASLLPAAIVGVVVNGLHSLFIILASVATAVLCEFVFDKICKKPDTWKDGSAVVTGMLLALSLSPSTPLYGPILGAAFAIIVAKCCFGGLGKNFINPALAGRCFLLISFGKSMTLFEVDGVATATPVADLAAGKAVNITAMFLGTGGGVIGASILALALGGLLLWAMDIIHGQIWISVLVGFTVFMGLFGGHGFDPEFLLAHLCGGGVIMGAFYMATDYTTSPVSRLGQTVYGLLIGILGALFRVAGSAADSFSYSIIIGNLFTPLIETYIIPKPYAYRKSAIALQNGEPQLPFWKKIPRPVIVLTVIALVTGAALGGVYTMTKGTIEEKKRQEKLASYKEVLPEGEEFVSDPGLDEKVSEIGGSYGTDFGKITINEAIIAKNASGETAGYGLSVTSGDGYDGNVTVSVGISSDGVVQGIAFTELHETAGMGMQAAEPAFYEQFKNRAVSRFKLLKGGGAAAADEIDGISGCTRTSTAVTNAVNAGLDFYENVLKGGNYGE